MTRTQTHTTSRDDRRVAALAATRDSWPILLAAALLLAGAALLAVPAMGAHPPMGANDDDADAYGFVRRVEGDVLLAGLEQKDAVDAEVNHPLLTGDQISTNSGRVEVILPDGSIVRIDRTTDVVFDSLGGSPDSDPDAGTLLLLDEGEIQVRTPEVFYGSEEFAVRTSNATIYLSAAGSYRLRTRGTSFTEVVVREGFAEADTRSGSAVARDGEALEVSGYSRPFVDVLAVGPEDGLEIWAEDLDRRAYDARSEYVDPRLAYAAEPLHDNGEWIVVQSRRVWRPYVRAGWRPFRYGRWVYSPSGLTWVASAPWGWVTSHYGSWDYYPAYGWLWYPGSFYRPAAVYWYWGPTYVGWVPYGYYGRHYGFYGGPGFGFGVYGWAGGDWGFWADWTFCPTRYFGRRGYHHYWDSGRSLARTRRFAVPRGIVTTDTRGLTRDRWGKPNEVHDVLVRRNADSTRVRELPDVTDFVARRKLTEAKIREIREETTGRSGAAKARLRPLGDESGRGRFTTPSSTDRGTSSVVRSRSGVSRDLGRDASGRRISSDRRDLGGNRESVTRRGTEIRRPLANTEHGTERSSETRSGGTRTLVRGRESEAGDSTGRSRSTVRDLSGTRDRNEGRIRTETRGGTRDRDEAPSRVERGTVRDLRGSRDRTRNQGSPGRRSLVRGDPDKGRGSLEGVRDLRSGSSSVRDRSGSKGDAPARRVLDSIREHRQSQGQTRGRSLTSRGDSRGSSSATRGTTSSRGSSTRGRDTSRRSGSRSSDVSKGSSGSRSSGVSRGSGSSSSRGKSSSARGGSDRSSGSSRSSTRKSSPPPRQSSARSNSRSGERSKARSGGSRGRVRRPD